MRQQFEIMRKSKYASIQILAAKPSGIGPIIAGFPAQQHKERCGLRNR
jgi:hypothetical protein